MSWLEVESWRKKDHLHDGGPRGMHDGNATARLEERHKNEERRE
jgi:hypothetical protein